MKYRIHYTHAHGEDAIIVEGETIEEVRMKALAEIEKLNPWSEKVEG